ncbi:MAG TPA: acetyl-CoA carboxylase carboxyl transferase subunit alpha/beta, partial [Candidatus Marinimicrobia bacterium]|nr:acetyl-CoA carboxylase carboxyl transferase subunit alpha/beta [Candidatus Neomarinimicrobiota bacterium]
MTEHTNHYYYSFEQEGNFSYSAEDIDQLSEYEKYQLSFHPERPKYLDYLSLFDSVEECFSSDEFGAWLIQTHRAEITINGSSIPLMSIGQQTGPTSRYNEMLEMMKDGKKVKHWNHGMPTPASYERAIRAVDAANEENRMIITFVDTPGADPTEESEAGGIAWRIGETI